MTEPHRYYFAETVFGPSDSAYYTMDRTSLIEVHCEGYASKCGKVGTVSPQIMARVILGDMKRLGKVALE